MAAWRAGGGIRRRGVGVFGAALLAAAAAAAAQTGGPAAAPRQTARPTGAKALQGLRLQAERQTPDQAKNVVVYGSGVGIWDRRLQYRVEDATLQRALDALEAAGFADMPEMFGGGRKWVTRRVSLRSIRLNKDVLQLLQGEQSQAFKALADRLFTLLEPTAGNGVTASGIGDGLKKVAAGELAPETLQLTLHFKPRSASAARPGFLLQVADGVAMLQAYVGETYGDQRSLGGEPIRKLAAVLAGADVEALPDNLYAADYTEVAIAVLNHRKSLLARQFAGMKPDAHADRQRRFDRLFGELKAVLEPSLPAAVATITAPPAVPSAAPSPDPAPRPHY